jgi:hypothetical protein
MGTLLWNNGEANARQQENIGYLAGAVRCLYAEQHDERRDSIPGAVYGPLKLK